MHTLSSAAKCFCPRRRCLTPNSSCCLWQPHELRSRFTPCQIARIPPVSLPSDAVPRGSKVSVYCRERRVWIALQSLGARWFGRHEAARANTATAQRFHQPNGSEQMIYLLWDGRCVSAKSRDPSEPQQKPMLSFLLLLNFLVFVCPLILSFPWTSVLSSPSISRSQGIGERRVSGCRLDEARHIIKNNKRWRNQRPMCPTQRPRNRLKPFCSSTLDV